MEHKEKTNHKTLELSKKAMPMDHKEKTNHKTLELSKKAMPGNASSVRTVFPASRSFSSYTSILQSESRSAGSRGNTVMKSIRVSSPEKGCKRKSPDRCNIRTSLKERTPDSSESLRFVPQSEIQRGSTSISEVRNANAPRANRHDSARDRVITTLRLYRKICGELSREKSRAGKESTRTRRIDFHAAKQVKQRAGYVHGAMQFIGDVPGVKMGDKFYYRMELAVVGLHRPPQSGIDYMGTHPDILATSVVASWNYTDNLSKPDELVYLGQGGMPGRGKKAEDQKLTRGNLALLNSMRRKKPVRVIRKDRDHTFTYDGLYEVGSCRKLRRANRQIVFEFLMKRMPGQPEICQKKKMKVHES